MDTTTLIGIIGSFSILLAFVLLQLGRWHQKAMGYLLANLVGSLFLCLYAWQLSAEPFLVLNGAWALVALRSIYKEYGRKAE